MKKITLITSLLLFTFSLFSQTDSSEDFFFSSLEEEVISLITKARNIGDKNPAEKLQLAGDALEISELEEFYDKQVDALSIMGVAYFQLFEIDKSLEALNQSYRIAHRINYTEGLWLTAYTLGTVYAYLGESVKATAFLKEADGYITSKTDIKHIDVYRELAKLYKVTRSYEQAVSTATNALIMSEELKDKKSILEISLLLGDIEYTSGNIRKANDLFIDIINRTSTTGDFQLIRSSAHSYMGKCFALLGDYHMALANGQDGLLLSVKNDSDSGRLEAYDSLAFTYQQMGDYERAYKNLNLYYDQKSLLEGKKSAENLDKIKTYFGTFEKEQEIDKQQLLIDNQNRLILAGSLLMALFIVLLSIFYLLYRKNSRIAEKLSQDLKKEMILSKTDPVTGLPNRKEMEDLLQKNISLWKKDYVNFSLIIISFEKYKNIDKEWGEGSGDEIQKFIGKVLQSELKGKDIISVWKPFLFMILLPATDHESLNSVRQKIYMRFTKTTFTYEKNNEVLELSIGSCTYSGDENRSSCIDRCRRDLEENLH